MKAIAIDLLSVLAILSSMILIPILVIAVIAVGIGLFKWITEKMVKQADELSDFLFMRGMLNLTQYFHKNEEDDDE